MQRSLVILSSSPPLRPDLAGSPPAIESGSNSVPPDLPSISSFRSSKLKGGSRAAPLPEDAVLGFQLASRLPRVEQDLEEVVAVDKAEGVKKVKRKDPVRRKAKANVDCMPPIDKDTAQIVDSAVEPVEGDPIPQQNPRGKPSKPRAKRVLTKKTSNEQVATEKKRGRPKKDVVERSEKAAQRVRTSTGKVSTHFTAPEIENGVKENAPIDLTLEVENTLATKRKLDWTPPRDTAVPTTTEYNALASGEALMPIDVKISGLLSNYGYTAECPVANLAETVAEPALLKRKRIELINVDGGSLPVLVTAPPQVSKISPKKKPKTITGYATEKYMPVGESAVTELLPSNALDLPLSKTGPRSTVSKSSTGRKRVEKDSSKSVKTKKKPEFVKPKLLSPVSAARRLDGQDVLFGTCSQLAHEESPTSLRDLQQALRDSETHFMSNLPKGKAPARFRSARISSTSTGGLWSAGALLSDDNPFNLEPPRHQAVEEKHQNNVSVASVEFPISQRDPSGTRHDEDEWKDIDDINSSTPPNIEKDYQSLGNLTSKPEATILDRLVPSKKLAGEPSEESISVAKASKSVSKQKISKAKTKTATLAAPEIGILAPVKRPRGRPRKTAVSEAPRAPSAALHTKAKAKSTSANFTTAVQGNEGWTSIDDIQDSEPDLTPSPPRRRRTKDASSQASELLLTSLDGSSKSIPAPVLKKGARPNWETIKDMLYPAITAAVKQAPRSSDPLNPSWHEKILLYDPIVVEDFTKWLNDGGLRCPASDDGDGKLVEPWMAQKWCEEASVCCVSKVSSWNGVRRPRGEV